MLLLVPAVLIVGVLIAVVPARSASRTRPAIMLRTA
jgi:ABC-type antimicrobial peptide transport system permease subunit